MKKKSISNLTNSFVPLPPRSTPLRSLSRRLNICILASTMTQMRACNRRIAHFCILYVDFVVGRGLERGPTSQPTLLPCLLRIDWKMLSINNCSNIHYFMACLSLSLSWKIVSKKYIENFGTVCLDETQAVVLQDMKLAECINQFTKTVLRASSNEK